MLVFWRGPLRSLAISGLTVLFAIGMALAASLYLAPEASSATPYTQVVDNSTSGRFSASKSWVFTNYHSDTNYGGNNRALKRSSATAGNARWKIKIPTRSLYTVYARWPSDPGYTDKATFKIKTNTGTKTKVVSQRINGGKWMKLGTWGMAPSDGWRIELASQSTSAGYIIADAVKVVQGTGATTTESGGTTGAQIVNEAETWIGVPYKWGGTTRQGVDCSGLTLRVYEKFGKSLPRTSQAQFDYTSNRRVSTGRPGDMVFFGSGPNDVVSVGIVSGPNEVIKATVPGDTVRRESISAVANSVGGWYAYTRII